MYQTFVIITGTASTREGNGRNRMQNAARLGRRGPTFCPLNFVRNSYYSTSKTAIMGSTELLLDPQSEPLDAVGCP